MPRRKTSSGQGSPPRPPQTPAASGKVTSERAAHRAFDLWLDNGLHEIFDGVTKEPIPEELLKLLKGETKE